MPWNFFITPANYWELKLGTNSESVVDSIRANFSSMEISNNTGMCFEKKYREFVSFYLSVYQNIWVKIKFFAKLRFILVQNVPSLNKQAFEFNVIIVTSQQPRHFFKVKKWLHQIGCKIFGQIFFRYFVLELCLLCRLWCISDRKVGQKKKWFQFHWESLVYSFLLLPL